MQDKTTLLETTSAGTWLKINRKKTELLKMNTTANAPVTDGGEPIKEVESFVYLASVVDIWGKHLGIWKSQYENQTPHLQLQCKVSPAVRM